MNRWELLLIATVIVPVLKKVALILEGNAKKTPGNFDDILAATFKAVVDALENPTFLKGQQ